MESENGFLYQGYTGSAQNEDDLKRAGITHILSCVTKIKPRFPQTFKYKVLELDDSPSCEIAGTFQGAIDFINEALIESNSSKVLVFCQEGVARSSTITLAFMV